MARIQALLQKGGIPREDQCAERSRAIVIFLEDKYNLFLKKAGGCSGLCIDIASCIQIWRIGLYMDCAPLVYPGSANWLVLNDEYILL